jgi:hypothetical protein
VRRINPDKVYVIVLAFFIASAGVRYTGEYLRGVISDAPALAEQAR